MKKVFKLVAMLSMFIFSFTIYGCNKSTSQSGKKLEIKNIKETKKLSSLQKIKNSGKIILGTSAAYPPYEFHVLKDGKDEIIGFDIDIAKEIAKKLGVQLETKDMDFKGLLPALKTGNIDFIIAGMTPTEDRKKEVDFSKVYYKGIQSLVILKENKQVFNSIESLKGKTIGAQKTTIQETIVKEKMPNSKINSISKIPDLILSVKNKKIQGVLLEYPVAKAYCDKNKDLVIANIKIGNEEADSAIAVGKGNEDLLKVINEVLDDLIKKNKIEEFVTMANEMVK